MKDSASRTASLIAVGRGLGRVLPAEARLIDDPYGERFSTPLLDVVRRHADGVLRMVLERFLLAVQVRTRLLDAALLSFLARGGTQVLLLGAGFDARALRFAAQLNAAGARVFEVDHPATQATKRARIDAAPHVTYLAWDFEQLATADLPAALAACGHDPTAPTFVLWEGVTLYLSEPAVDATTRAVASLCAPGSLFAFTYVDRAALTRPNIAIRLIRLLVRSLGEPITFGFVPSELAAWLATRGFSLEHDVSITDAARALLPARFAALFVGQHARVAFCARSAQQAASHGEARDPGVP